MMVLTGGGYSILLYFLRVIRGEKMCGGDIGGGVGHLGIRGLVGESGLGEITFSPSMGAGVGRGAVVEVVVMEVVVV